MSLFPLKLLKYYTLDLKAEGRRRWWRMGLWTDVRIDKATNSPFLQQENPPDTFWIWFDGILALVKNYLEDMWKDGYVLAALSMHCMNAVV